MATHNSLAGYEPNKVDCFDCSKASSAIFQDESSDMDTEQSYLFDAEPDDETIGESAIFTIVSTARRTSELETQAYHSHEESLLPAVLFHTHKYGETRFRSGAPKGVRGAEISRFFSQSLPNFWRLATARTTLRPHTGPQGDSQLTASTIEFTLFLLQVCMCFCPLHTTV